MRVNDRPASGIAEVSLPLLVVTPVEQDRAALRWILAGSEWKLQEASGCQAAFALLANQPFPVLICARDLAVGDWKSLKDGAKVFPKPPLFLVYSRETRHDFRRDVLQHGGFNELRFPFQAREVRLVASLAWLRWSSRYGTPRFSALPEKHAAQTGYSLSYKKTG
jgi:hypothetical protein